MKGTIEFENLKVYIEEQSGILFTEHNDYILENQLQLLLKHLDLKNVNDLYLKLLVYRDTDSLQKLLEGIMTHETFWFRDPSQWNLMEKVLMPRFIDQIRSDPDYIVRIWSGACSSGQEPYSVAMTIAHYLALHKISDVSMRHFQIIGTDISGRVLDIARKGIYDRISIARGLEEYKLNSFFIQNGEHWNINEEIRQSVHFRQFNLAKEQFKQDYFDVILFKNVMIYFSEKFKLEMLKNMAYSLKEDGILFIGSSEIMEDPHHLFLRQQQLDCVYYSKNLVKK